MRRRIARPLLRTAAAVTIGAAVALPFVRRRLGVSPGTTMGLMVAAPVALAVVRPRTRSRDAALFFLQMWAYLVAHELPYDDPDRLRARLKVRYPIAVDRLIGAGQLPNVRLQRALASPTGPTRLDAALTGVHWSWFLEPYAALAWILARDDEAFARAARQMAAVYDLGAVVYATVPTAPPWWASDEGHVTEGELRRLMVEVGEEFWGDGVWQRLYGFFGGNPWAAMPSLHFATALMAALLLRDTGRIEGALGWTYAAVLGFALVYLGEHYVVDLLAGAALVAGVRAGERLVEPWALSLSRAIQRLEGLAAA